MAGELKLSTLAVSVRLFFWVSVQVADAFRRVSVAVKVCVPSKQGRRAVGGNQLRG